MALSRHTLNPEQTERRAANAIAQYFSHKLIVPKIYLEARWPSRNRSVDLLAVDRSGIGDIHVVEIKSFLSDESRVLAQLHEIPAHYKYFAVFTESVPSPVPRRLRVDPHTPALYDSSGIGRIGIIHVFEDQAGVLSAVVALPPERFRVQAKYIESMDKFVSKTHPFLESRE